MLSQWQEDKEVVVVYKSHALTKSENKYCITRKELLVAIIFIQHFCPYLLGSQFLL